MMKSLMSGAVLGLAALALVGCEDQPVQRVAVPSPTDQNAYEPTQMPKPLPPNGMPGPELYSAPPAQPGQPAPDGQTTPPAPATAPATQ